MNDLPIIQAVLTAKARKLPALRSHRRDLSYEWASPFAYVDQREHGVGEVGVLLQTSIVNRPGFSGGLRVIDRSPSATDSLTDSTTSLAQLSAYCRSAPGVYGD